MSLKMPPKAGNRGKMRKKKMATTADEEDPRSDLDVLVEDGEAWSRRGQESAHQVQTEVHREEAHLEDSVEEPTQEEPIHGEPTQDDLKQD